MPQDAGFPDPATPLPRNRPSSDPVIGRIDPAGYVPDLSGPPPALTAAPDLGALIRSLRHRWMMAAALGLPLALLAAAAAWFLMAPKYTAIAQWRVLSLPPVVLNRDGASRGDFPTYIRTLAAQLKSRPVIMEALKGDDIKRLNLDAQRIDPAAYIEEELKVEFADQVEFLTLLMSSNDPAEAVGVVKGISKAFGDQILDAEGKARTKQLADLGVAYAAAAGSLNDARVNLKKLADSSKTSDRETLSYQQVLMIESLHDARNSRNQIATSLLETQASLDAHKTRLDAAKNMPLPEANIQDALDADPESKQLTERIKRMEIRVSEYGEGSSEPTAIESRRVLRRLKKELDDRRTEVTAKAKRVIDKRDLGDLELVRNQLENRVKFLTDELDRREKVVNDLATEVAKFGASSSEIESLRAEVRRKEHLVADLGERVDRLNVEAKSNPPRVIPFQDADLQRKDSKKQILATIAAPIAMLFTVCMGVAWIEHRQRRVRSGSELTEGLGIRVVGAVPAVRHPERHLVGANGEPDLDAYPALESFDAIRTLLLHDAHSGPARVVQVTSAVAGEGKTTLASHLATSLARSGRKTLLLDGDLRRPAVHQLFELPLQPGFAEVLLAEVEVSDAVQPTTLPGMSVMSAGQWDREVLQALARNGLEGVFEKLQEEFDFIIVDSHPVLPAADALLLARRVDAVILSVLREFSQTPRVYSAMQRLTTVGARVLGAVINAASAEEAFANPSLAEPIAR